MLNERQLKLYKRLFNQNITFLREVATSTTYSKRFARLAKELLLKKEG